jgi:hypothetical protein
MSDKNNIKEERFIFLYIFKGFSLSLLGPTSWAEHCGSGSESFSTHGRQKVDRETVRS